MSDVKVDFITNTGSSGIGNVLTGANISDPGTLRPWIDDKGVPHMTVHMGGDKNNPANYKNIQANSGTLRRDEWKQLDEAIVPIAENRLTGIRSLVSRGLVFNLGNAFGTTILESHGISDAFEAELTMDGITRSKGDRQEFSHTYLPIPITHVDYEINARVLEASRRMGNPLDTTSAERAARKVAEKIEKMLYSAETYAYGGGTIYSFLNFPHRNTDTLTKKWTEATPAEILADVVKMKEACMDDGFYGPYILYVPTAYETVLDKDYSIAGASMTTIGERLLKLKNIVAIEVVDTMAGDNVIMVQASTDVVRVVNGMGVTNVQWKAEGNFVNLYKVMAIQVPQLRADFNNKCGIAHFSK